MKKLSPSLIWRHQDSKRGRTEWQEITEQQYPGHGRTHVCVRWAPAWRQGGLGGSLGQVKRQSGPLCALERPLRQQAQCQS